MKVRPVLSFLLLSVKSLVVSLRGGRGGGGGGEERRGRGREKGEEEALARTECWCPITQEHSAPHSSSSKIRKVYHSQRMALRASELHPKGLKSLLSGYNKPSSFLSRHCMCLFFNEIIFKCYQHFLSLFITNKASGYKSL